MGARLNGDQGQYADGKSIYRAYLPADEVPQTINKRLADFNAYALAPKANNPTY